MFSDATHDDFVATRRVPRMASLTARQRISETFGHTFVIRSKRGVRYTVKMTCLCSPQQWELYVNGRVILYVRCRSNWFTAHYIPNGFDKVDGEIAKHLLMEIFIHKRGEPAFGNNAVISEMPMGGVGNGELFTEKDMTKYLKRAVNLCDQWRANEAAGVENVAPYSYLEEEAKRLYH